jgi:hypothetical protein
MAAVALAIRGAPVFEKIYLLLIGVGLLGSGVSVHCPAMFRLQGWHVMKKRKGKGPLAMEGKASKEGRCKHKHKHASLILAKGKRFAERKRRGGVSVSGERGGRERERERGRESYKMERKRLGIQEKKREFGAGPGGFGLMAVAELIVLAGLAVAVPFRWTSQERAMGASGR